MPATTYNASTGVKVPIDRVHKGPGQVSVHSTSSLPSSLQAGVKTNFDTQAGNKSALTYRCDIGVPGYTGFIPQTAAIPLQVKGSTKYIGEQPRELPHSSICLFVHRSPPT